MSRVKETRQKAFKHWVEYDNKANLSKRTVNRLEWRMVEAHSGIEDNTARYHDNEAFWSMWFDWHEEYEKEIIQHAQE